MRKELESEEVELREMTDSTLTKLVAMTDENFDKLELPPNFDEEDRQRKTAYRT